jgi:hypothetical protein
MVIDEALKTFIESEVAATVGTCNADLIPAITFGWGPRVLPRSYEVEVFLDRAAAAQVVANLNDNRRIAVNMGSPITVRAVQIKGWCVEIGEAAPEDAAWIQRHRDEYGEAMRARGVPSHVTRSTWSRDVIRLRFAVEEVFDQTPGPGAGKRL